MVAKPFSFVLALALLTAISGVSASTALAATLNVSPNTTSVQAGDIVTVRLVANTQGTAINQGEGSLRFPTDMLDVVATSKSGSIFTLWVEEPAYSNSAGTVTFDGGVPTPGYNGSSGTILSITFHAKRSGTATLSLSDAALRANDGLGTDVLTSSGGAQITITEVVSVPAPTIVPQTSTPAEPTPSAEAGDILSLASPTHSDQNAWYQNTSPLITWQLPAGATSIQTIVDNDRDAVPTVTYKPAIVEKRIANLEDGIWYFNIRARTGTTWGPTAHYTLQIDSVVPELSEASFEYDAAGRKILISNVSAIDAVSGIDHFELSIDGEVATSIPADAFTNGSYAYPYTNAGTHAVTLRAFDRAGNASETTGTFTVPTSLANQVLWSVGGTDITFGWFIILILLISLLALIAAGTAWYKLYLLHHDRKSRTEKRDKVLHRSLRIYKEELERHLRTLERAGARRELTDAEAEINEDLKKNVDDLEKYLKKEFKKFD